MVGVEVERRALMMPWPVTPEAPNTRAVDGDSKVLADMVGVFV